MSARRVVLWVVIVVVLIGIPTTVLILLRRHRVPISLRGAVIIRDVDPNKEVPISDVEITVTSGTNAETTRSDSSGFFSIRLLNTIRRGYPITMTFRHPNYRPLDIKEHVGDRLYIAKMVPLSQSAPPPDTPRTRVGNVRVRYLIKTSTTVNIGSAVKTFQVVNTGNVPCNGVNPCSPDGKWKAAIGEASLDAGPGNEFHSVRVTCIAGPCPFTKIETDRFSQGGQNIMVAARNWSDTTTFLFEAEVFHPMVSDVAHQSYPVIFGQALSFTLPSTAQGVSIQADLNGTTIIFPLGPALRLSWAECTARVNPDQTKVYRCQLKRGYQFS
jgi:hypothetical protein